MKNLSTVLAIALLPFIGFSQSIFDKYEDMDNVGSVTVNKSMIRLAGNLAAMDEDDEDAQEFKAIAHGLNGIKVFITEDKKISADMGGYGKEVFEIIIYGRIDAGKRQRGQYQILYQKRKRR